MAILLLADIHGMYPALSAILSSPEAKRCDRIISLGDQVNFGPQSRLVMDTLSSLDALMLMGNHEERLLHPGDFSGYNWHMLHLTAQQMQGARIDQLPVDVRIGRTLLTHGTPGDPYHLVYEEDLPGVLDSLPEDVDLLLSGHNHLLWDVRHGQRRAFNPGSAGLNEAGNGGMARFAVWDGEELTSHLVPYSIDDTIRAYIAMGYADAAPEMIRACIQELRTAEYQGVLHLLRHVHQTASQMGLTIGDKAAWQQADTTYHWIEHPHQTTAEYWAEMKERFA